MSKSNGARKGTDPPYAGAAKLRANSERRLAERARVQAERVAAEAVTPPKCLDSPAVVATVPTEPDPLHSIPPSVTPPVEVPPSSTQVVELTSESPTELVDSTIDAGLNVVPLEHRIGLRARLTVEEALRDPSGLSKKERVELALKAISVLEKEGRHWVISADARATRSEEEVARDLRAAEERLRVLLQRRGGGEATPARVEAALAVIDGEKQLN